MIKKLIFVFLCVSIIGSVNALTGFGVSNLFVISEETLPVELSAFTASITAQNNVQLHWTTQSETNVNGYYIYRSNDKQLTEAILISSLIEPTNTSSQQSYSYTDMELMPEGVYYYWLNSMDMDGSGDFYGPVKVTLSLESDPEIPSITSQTGIRSIYPNPFNPSTTIAYHLKNPADINISIYNTRGQLSRSYQRSHSVGGDFSLFFDGNDESGRQLSSGIYQVVMRIGKDKLTQKMVLVK